MSQFPPIEPGHFEAGKSIYGRGASVSLMTRPNIYPEGEHYADPVEIAGRNCSYGIDCMCHAYPVFTHNRGNRP